MKVAPSVSLLFLAALAPRAEAQVLCALGSAATPYNSMVDMPPSPSAQGELKRVKAALCPKGCGQVFLFANSTTPNTTTVTDGLGVSKIAYSPTFINAVKASYGPIASLGIFAHELGHHIESTAKRATWMKDGWDAELRADAWAGCALAKAELKPSGLQAAMGALSTYPAVTHPSWSVRLPVIQAGYVQCGGGRTLALMTSSKEETETADRPAKTVARKGDVPKDDPPLAAAGPRGCTGDKDCRNGRACVEGRCGPAPVRRRCGKDTDCPEPQECGGAGYCDGGPAGQEQSQQRSQPGSSPEEVPAAFQESHAAPSPAPKDLGPCLKSCDDKRTHCVEAAGGEINKCLGAIRSDPSYRACSCPNYPAGNFGCYRFCMTAYEQGKACATPDRDKECKTEGDRCRAACQ